MNLIEKSLLMVLIFVISPLFVGNIISKLADIQRAGIFDKVVYRYIVGNMTMWAVYQVVAVPLILMKKSFMMSVYIWSCIIMMLFACNIILFIKKLISKEYTASFNKKINWQPQMLFTIIIVTMTVLLVGYQCYNYVFYMHIDDDDSRFIVNACEAYDTDTMLLNNPATGEYEGTWHEELTKDVTSPWSFYIALLSKCVHIYPTIVAHTILPVFLLIIAYGVFWLFGKSLFDGDWQKSCVFVFFIALLQTYFNSSVYTSATFLLTRIWQGKAVVAGIMFPLQLYFLYLMHQQKHQFGNYILIMIANTASCLLSGMGIFLIAVVTVIYGLYYTLMDKKWLGILLVLLTCVPNGIFALLYYSIK
jgi:hypothetical protein